MYIIDKSVFFFFLNRINFSEVRFQIKEVLTSLPYKAFIPAWQPTLLEWYTNCDGRRGVKPPWP